VPARSPADARRRNLPGHRRSVGAGDAHHRARSGGRARCATRDTALPGEEISAAPDGTALTNWLTPDALSPSPLPLAGKGKRRTTKPTDLTMEHQVQRHPELVAHALNSQSVAGILDRARWTGLTSKRPPPNASSHGRDARGFPVASRVEGAPPDARPAGGRGAAMTRQQCRTARGSETASRRHGLLKTAAVFASPFEQRGKKPLRF
jgi:hypothetical protein